MMKNTMTRLGNDRTRLLKIGGLMLASALIGAFIVMNLNLIPLGFAGPNDITLGSGAAPVAVSNEVQSLNDAFIAVSKGVTPQVVSITVTSSMRPSSRDLPFDDPFGMFSFPENQMPQRGSGSGVVVTSDGYILTNNHVVATASKDGIQVETYDGNQYAATLIGTDPTTDLAVIKIEASGLPVAAIGKSDQIQVGQIVFAVGNPLGLNSTVTQGIISAIGRGQLNLNRDEEGYGIEDFLQTDAAINPGNSGGGLFNLTGELIGINSAIATNTGYNQGYGFAIPIDLAVAVAKDLIEDGEVNRGYIGVMIKAVDQKLAKYHKLSSTHGVLIEGVQAKGSAAIAGLKQGDIILEIDGTPVNSANQLQSLIARKRVGDEVTLKVFRYGDTFDKSVTLKAKPSAERVTESRESSRSGSASGSGTAVSPLGMELGELTSREKRYLDIEKGVVVRGVEVYGEAFEGGIQEGDVILSLNREAVSSVDDVTEILEDAEDGDVVLVEVQRGDGIRGLVALEINR